MSVSVPLACGTMGQDTENLRVAQGRMASMFGYLTSMIWYGQLGMDNEYEYTRCNRTG